MRLSIKARLPQMILLLPVSTALRQQPFVSEMDLQIPKSDQRAQQSVYCDSEEVREEGQSMFCSCGHDSALHVCPRLASAFVEASNVTMVASKAPAQQQKSAAYRLQVVVPGTILHREAEADPRLVGNSTVSFPQHYRANATVQNGGGTRSSSA